MIQIYARVTQMNNLKNVYFSLQFIIFDFIYDFLYVRKLKESL